MVEVVLRVPVECNCMTLARHLYPCLLTTTSPIVLIEHFQIGPLQGFLTYRRLNLDLFLSFHRPTEGFDKCILPKWSR